MIIKGTRFLSFFDILINQFDIGIHHDSPSAPETNYFSLFWKNDDLAQKVFPPILDLWFL